jgi:predicted TIM-barrel enzyme
MTIEETAVAAEFFLSDGLIITGASTGYEADLSELKSVKNKVKLPVIIGSGITESNIDKFFPYCDAMIVGSYFKKNGNWKNAVDISRVKSFIKKINRLR